MYTELQVTSNFSFLRGASHPEELMASAASLGYTAIAITDRNTLAGIVRAHVAAKKAGIRLIPGARIDLQDGPSLLAYPTNAEGYAQLCEVLTIGNRRAEKGSCLLYKKDLYAGLKDVKLIVLPPDTLNNRLQIDPEFVKQLFGYREVFGNRLYLAARRLYNGQDAKYLFRLQELSHQSGVPLIATNDVHFHHPDRRALQDIITCVRKKTTIQQAGYLLHPNAERYLKDEAEITRLFRACPDAVTRTREIVEACTFSLDELHYEYPEEIVPEGRTPQEELERLTWEGAHAHFGAEVPVKTQRILKHELAFIKRKDFAPYFLTVYDIVRFARSRGILCQGRGSAANSTVCFCLGITSVNPEKFDLLFERFISDARNEPPDIDVDFEHERREEVIQYIYEKYGRDRAAIVATVTELHHKGAIRDVAKAMGLSKDTVDKLASPKLSSAGYFEEARLRDIGLNPEDPFLKKVLAVTEQYMGFPRQLGQHTGGFIISRHPLSRLCPVLNARMEDRTNIEWNKDDVEALGFLKIDVLALGMLTCIRKCFHLIRDHYGKDYTLATIPQDDPEVYAMIARADTIGVFQIESRAQQSMLPRLKPNCFYDLVIEVAIVRPGPIQGDMVHPYLRRRNGEEPVDYPSEELREILHKTLGVPLFQEQAMKIAIVAAGFTPAEADELRRSMATFKAKGKVSQLEQKLIRGMLAKGYTLDYAQRIFRQLEGFGSYGFPESHAASFAQLVYVSCWIKYHYPDVFACGLLNSQPMGFYQPAQIVIDAQNHGVPVLPVDVNHSDWDCTLEATESGYKAMRLGMRQVKGLKEEEGRKMEEAVNIHRRVTPQIESRGTLRINNIDELRNLGLSDSTLELLADADTFRSIGLDRRQALWQISKRDHPELLFEGHHPDEPEEKQVELPLMPFPEQVMHDYARTDLSLKAHPMRFLREKLGLLKAVENRELKELPNGTWVKVSGLVLMRQRPGTAKGVWFITLEDESGIANLVLFPNVVEQFRREMVQARVMMVEGKLQVEGIVIHVLVQKVYNITPMLMTATLIEPHLSPLPAAARTDEVLRGEPEDVRVLKAKQHIPGSRDFR